LEEKNVCGATTKEGQVLVDEAMEKRILNGGLEVTGATVVGMWEKVFSFWEGF
jgi:hypothetical protein